MYRSFYGFQIDPFGPLPPPHVLYLTETHREALATLVYGVLERKPFVVILGEVGVGKSTVLKAAMARLADEPIRLVEVSHPLITPDRFTQLLARAVGVADPDRLTYLDIDQVDAAHCARADEVNQIAFMIDEAQLMPHDTLEFIRLVSNMKATQSGLLQFIFVGQPEFWTVLERPEFRHLKQRIAIRCRIAPLSPKEARNYIEFRLQMAGATIAQTMTKGALDDLIRQSGGIPRRINVIADNALLTAYGAGIRPMTAAHVREAVRGVDGLPKPATSWRRRFIFAGSCAAALILGAVIATVIRSSPEPGPESAAAAAGAVPTAPSSTPAPTVPAPLPAPPVPPERASVGLAPPPPTSPATVPLGAAPPLAAEVKPVVPPVPVAVSPPVLPPPPAAVPKAAAPATPWVVPVEQAPPPLPPVDRSNLEKSAAAASPVSPQSGVPSATLAPDSQGTAPVSQKDLPPSPSLMRYKVAYGETTFAIVKRFYGGLNEKTLELFLAANPSIRNSNKIIAGSYILVPSSAPHATEK